MEGMIYVNAIISKIDYEMNEAINFGYFESSNLWLKIIDKNYILEKAITVVEDDEKNKMFFAPAICYMILKNPQDIENPIYSKLVKLIIENDGLGRITINNETFLSLCLSNPFLDLDENGINSIVDIINTRYYPDPTGNINITYEKLPMNENKVIEYSDDRMKLDITNDDIEAFKKRSYINITQGDNASEIEELTRLFGVISLDPEIQKAITKQYEKYLMELELISKNGEEIIRLIREKNRLVK